MDTLFRWLMALVFLAVPIAALYTLATSEYVNGLWHWVVLRIAQRTLDPDVFAQRYRRYCAGWGMRLCGVDWAQPYVSDDE